jgi:hypothetical protein
MAWDAAFVLVNLIAFCGWAALVLLPRLTSVSALVLYLAVGLLCVAYTVTFVAVFGGLVDPHRLPGVPPPDLTDYSIAGLRPLFMSDAGILIGWTHYLTFDLFVGRWIAADADRKGYSRLAQVPFLFATLMAGPIGLLAWLVARGRGRGTSSK